MTTEKITRKCTFDGCGDTHYSRGYCKTHYQCWWLYGDPAPRMLHISEDGFWANVDKNGPIIVHMDTPCWMWTAYRNADGYGQSRWEGRSLWLSHRLAYFLHTGTKPGKHVLHHCDNPSCVRPDHLYEGTDQDNVDDMVSRGRHARGEQTPQATITEVQARNIKQDIHNGMKPRDAAKKHGAKPSIGYHIAAGTAWKHVTI